MMKKRTVYLCLIISQIVGVYSCCSPQESLMNEKMEIVSELTSSINDTLSIYIGHQSVGENIFEGVESLISNTSIRNVDGEIPLNSSGVYHGKNGVNKKPFTKIAEFESFINENGSRLNAAGFKFCYVDIKESSNVDSLFWAYCEMVDRLESRFPQLMIVHFTVPIRSVDQGVKRFVKELIGKNTGIKDNIAREVFNTQIRKTYTSGNLFDIAYYESVDKNGKEVFVSSGNHSVRYLRSEYTYDGGHLTELGKEFLAIQFINFLSGIK